MSILNIQTAQPTGLASVNPSIIYIETSDTYAVVTASGYLTQQAAQGFAFSNDQMALVKTSDDGVVWLQIAITFSGSSVLNTVVSLVEITAPGDVILPTIANHIATFTNATGTISEDPAIAISGGSIQAGLSGTAGSFFAYPATASKGHLALVAVANTGNTVTTITNVAMGQASVISLPDPGTATANFVIAPAALVSGNLIKASGTAGLIVDTGIPASSLATVTTPTIANHLATYTNTAGNISEDAATAINGGNLQAGLSGTAGTLISFPSTASKGSFIVAAVANTGNTTTTISNNAMGQASVVNIPDPSNAIGQLLISATATPFVSGNFPIASGVAGLMIDSGVAATTLMQNNIVNTMTSSGQIILSKVNGTESGNAVTASGNAGVITTSSLSTPAGASYAITWTNTKISPTSVITMTIQGGTNTNFDVQFLCIPGSGSAILAIINVGPTDTLNGTIFIGYSVL